VALGGTHRIRQILSERSGAEGYTFVRDFADEHVKAGYLMILAADLGCARAAGCQESPERKNPKLAGTITRWWIEPGVSVLRHLANQGVLRSWGRELPWIFHYLRRVHRESAFFTIREASVRWANELRKLIFYKSWEDTLTPTACQLLTNITLFLHWCIDVQDTLPARCLLLGRAGLEQLDWPNQPIMKHWQDTGAYSGNRLRKCSKTLGYQNLLKSIKALWMGFFDVGGHALYQAFHEGKGSKALADHIELLCDAIRLEPGASTGLEDSFLEDVLAQALEISIVSWSNVPGVHREPKSFYFPRLWAVLRVVLDARGKWPAERMAEPSKIRENQRAFDEGLGMFDREEGKEVVRMLIRNGILNSEEQINDSIKHLKAAIKEKVAREQDVIRKAVAKAPIVKLQPYLDGIRMGFREALEETRKFVQVEQNAQLSDFGSSDFSFPWGMEVERRFLVGDEVDPHRGYIMSSGESVGEDIASAMLQESLQEIARRTAQDEPRIRCKFDDLADRWVAEIERLKVELKTTEFIICPQIDLETEVFSLMFDLHRKELTDATVVKLQNLISLRDSFKRLENQEMLGGKIDAVFFRSRRSANSPFSQNRYKTSM